MKSLLQPKRYQLTKHAVRIVHSGHPWIFKSHLSSASCNLAVGQWLKLVDSENKIVGYGIRDVEGAIGIRVLSKGPRPDTQFWKSLFDRAVSKRAELRKYTDGFRALHGENDGVPGVVIDVYGSTGVLQTYSPAVDILGRFAALQIQRMLELKTVVWRMPSKRKQVEAKPLRVLRGSPVETVTIREGKLQIAVPILAGQKGGMFLDLRHLRKWLSLRSDLKGRVLNLFSYTGTLGMACEMAGAREIWNVDSAIPSLDFGKLHHELGRARVKWIQADVFRFTIPLTEKFDCIIVDPPQLASDTTQVDKAFSVYRKLLNSMRGHLAPRGRLIVASCTSRIDRKEFESFTARVLGDLTLEANLKTEDDHPIGFPEGDYLKVLVYRDSTRR